MRGEYLRDAGLRRGRAASNTVMKRVATLAANGAMRKNTFLRRKAGVDVDEGGDDAHLVGPSYRDGSEPNVIEAVHRRGFRLSPPRLLEDRLGVRSTDPLLWSKRLRELVQTHGDGCRADPFTWDDRFIVGLGQICCGDDKERQHENVWRLHVESLSPTQFTQLHCFQQS